MSNILRRPVCWFRNHHASIVTARRLDTYRPGLQLTCERCGLRRWVWKV